MHIDTATVLLTGIFVKALIAALFLVLWLYDRRSTWFAWWSLAVVFGIATALMFLTRGYRDDPLALRVGGAALVACFGCCWQGARPLNHRRASVLAALAPAALWLVICLVPGFLANPRLRVLVSSLLIAPTLAMAAIEFWRGREERLLSRWPMIIVLCSLSLLFAARIPLMDYLPFPLGALPGESMSFVAFNTLMYLHSFPLTVLVVSLSKERLELQQRTRALTDPLTGTLNRRAFMSRGSRLVERHKRDNAPMCVLFLDIDHFKSINDQLGHAGGDDALIKFVDVAQSSIRPTDMLFRIGGEEFSCLLPNTTCDDAQRVAERIRRQFEGTTVSVGNVPVMTTVSLGIASTETSGYDIDTLMRHADKAVYLAKRRGRNQVAVAETTTAGALLTLRSGSTV